jgi:hypothetical protein
MPDTRGRRSSADGPVAEAPSPPQAPPAPPTPVPPAGMAGGFPVMIVVGVVVGVLVLAAVGAGAFFLLRPAPGPTPAPQPTPTTGPVTTSTSIHTVPSVSPDANVQGWIDAPLVRVSLTASSDAGGPAPRSITYSVTGALSLPSTTAQGSSVTFDLVAPDSSTTPEGVSTIAFAGQDVAGGQEGQQTFVVKVDRTPPTIEATQSPGATGGWNSTDVTVSFTCTDAIAEIASCDPPKVVVTTPGANQTVTGVATNKAGKAAAKTVTVNLDKTPPTITASATIGANAAAYTPGQWANAPVTVSFKCEDNLSGIATCPPAQQFAKDGKEQFASGAPATDRAGNRSAQPQPIGPINVDLTPPSVTHTEDDRVIQGVETTFVTVQASDATSGVASLQYSMTGDASGTDQSNGAPLTIRIPASMSKDLSVTVNVTAQDNARNGVTDQIQVTVPRQEKPPICYLQPTKCPNPP